MALCPLCGSPAEMMDVVIESYDVDCPECKKFRTTARALAFVQQNPAQVRDQLPLVSRASRHADVPLFITDVDDIADIAGKQRDKEEAASQG